MLEHISSKSYATSSEGKFKKKRFCPMWPSSKLRNIHEFGVFYISEAQLTCSFITMEHALYFVLTHSHIQLL